MIDTHAHLAMLQSFPPETLLVVLNRAWEAGLEAVIVPAGEPEDLPRIVRIAQEHPRVFGLLGYHPEHAGTVSLQDVKGLRMLLMEEGIIGVGEAGIDFYWKDDAATRADQVALCGAQLELAGELGLPISLHLRDKDGRGDAADALIRLLAAHPANAVIHSCTASPEIVRTLLGLGCAISFSGIATFPSAGGIRESAKIVPANKILVETDAPFLAPVPHRGRTNEPAYVRATADALAAERGESPSAFWTQCGANARRIFGLPSSRA